MNYTCDGCGKERPDVQSCGTDYNGDPDAPDLCFLCRKEGERGRLWDSETSKYQPSHVLVERERTRHFEEGNEL